jgi:cytochrome c-type biogenesis protein CcmH
MLLAVVFVVITIAVLAIVTLPMIRGARAAPERAQYDRAVYRDQINELERDVVRGLIGEREARAARLEIQRRMLASDAAAKPLPARRAPTRVLALVLCLLVVCVSAGLYLRLGSPGVPDEPFASRVIPHAATAANDGQHDVQKAAAALAEKLAKDPTNKERWLLYARTTAELGDWQKSVDAYHHVIELGETGPDTMSAYGEMLVMADAGMVTPAAHDAFAATLAKQPKNDVARFYLALGDAQAGEPRKAIDAWLALAAEAPDGSAMREEVVRRITETAKNAGLPMPTLPPAAPAQAVAGPAAGGPRVGPEGDADAEAAVAKLPPAQQSEVIRGMVTQLAAKLEAQPNDVDGWLRLGRSYGVLGEADKSAAAFERAAKLKPDDTSITLQEAQALLENQRPNTPVPPRAVELLHRIEATQPDQPEVLWYLGAAAAQDGRVDVAERYWQRLLPLLPADGPDQKLVREALDSLKAK